MISELILLACLQLEDKVRRYLENPAERAAIERELAKCAVTDVERAIRAYRPAATGAGVVRRRIANPYAKDLEAEYLIRVPEHDPKEFHPLFVSLHETNAESNLKVWEKSVALGDAQREINAESKGRTW